MAEAGSSAIFRIDAVDDTEADAKTAGQIIEFNSGAAPDSTGRLVSTGFKMTRDVSPHPNPNRANTYWQDNLLGTTMITIAGYFVDHDSTLGPAKMYNWMKEVATNAALPFGRFGLRLDDFAGEMLALTPSAGAGYILIDVDVQDRQSPRDQISFVATFVRNGTA